MNQAAVIHPERPAGADNLGANLPPPAPLQRPYPEAEAASAAATAAQKPYPVLWQLSAVREELNETRVAASKTRRRNEELERECNVLEARIVEACSRRKELEEAITEQLRRRANASSLAATTKKQKEKILLRGGTKAMVGDVPGIRSSSSSSRSGGAGAGGARSSSASSAPSRARSSGGGATGGSNEDKKKQAFIIDEMLNGAADSEDSRQARELAELRWKHRLFREEIMKWQKKRRLLEDASLKMSTQAEEEKLFRRDDAKAKKGERKLLKNAHILQKKAQFARDDVDKQSRVLGKELGMVRARVQDAEDEVAKQRRQMDNLRKEAAEIQKSVVAARKDTAQSVISAQEALQSVRFQEQKALQEAKERRREARDRATGAAGAAESGGGGGGAAAKVAADLKKQMTATTGLTVSGTTVASGISSAGTVGPRERDGAGDSDNEDEQPQQRGTAAAASASASAPVANSSPKYSTPADIGSAAAAAAASNRGSYHNSQHHHQQQQQQHPSSSAFPSSFSSYHPKAHTVDAALAQKAGKEYTVFQEGQDPREAWTTLAPKDGADTQEMLDELARIVRVVSVEFGKPRLELLRDLPDQ